jgi:hypothetical protein
MLQYSTKEERKAEAYKTYLKSIQSDNQHQVALKREQQARAIVDERQWATNTAGERSPSTHPVTRSPPLLDSITMAITLPAMPTCSRACSNADRFDSALGRHAF